MYLVTRCLWQYRDAARQRPAAYVLILNHDVSIAVGFNAVDFLDYRAKPTARCRIDIEILQHQLAVYDNVKHSISRIPRLIIGKVHSDKVGMTGNQICDDIRKAGAVWIRRALALVYRLRRGRDGPAEIDG